jgi:excisionase family DNA binding protein
VAPTVPLCNAEVEVNTGLPVTISSELRLGRSVSIDQAGQLLKVSRRTIYYWIRDGRLQTVRTLGGSQRVLVESLYHVGFRPQPFPTSASAITFAVRPAARG